MAKAIPFVYPNTKDAGRRPNGWYDPSMKPRISSVHSMIEQLGKLIKENYTSPVRVQTVSVRLLEAYLELADAFVSALEHKCVGEDDEAFAVYEDIRLRMGKKEGEMVRYYDHFHFMSTLYYCFYERTRTTEEKKNAPAATAEMYADGNV